MNYDNTPLCKVLGPTPTLELLSFMLAHKSFDYSKTELAKNTEMTRQTVYRALEPLEQFSLVRESRKIGRMTMYQLNENSELLKSIEKFNNLTVRKIIEAEKGIPLEPKGGIDDIREAFQNNK